MKPLNKLTLFMLLIGLAIQQAAASEPDPVLPSRIDVNPQYAVYEPIVATVQGPESLILWDRATTFQSRMLDEGKVLHIWAPPGRHHLSCRLIGLKTDEKGNHSLVILGEPSADFTVGTGPEPKPDPKPDPDPKPVPYTKLWGLFLYESNVVDDEPWQANIIASQKIRQFQSAKLNLDWVDVDAKDQANLPSPDLKPWIAEVAKRKLPLPQVVFVSEKGELIHVQAWPRTVDENVKLLQQYLPK